jgi:hypothetical protein
MDASGLRSLLARQSIVYRVPGTRWDEALPIGDGCFGAMAYQEDRAFLWTINHLDVYMAFNPDSVPIPVEFAGRYDEIVRQAREAHLRPGSPEALSCILYPSYFTSYGWIREGAWMNLAGQLRLEMAHPAAEAVEFEQVLNLYDAAVESRCRWAEGAWEVSAKYRAGRTRWVEVVGRAGGTCRLVVNGKTISVTLKPGQRRRLAFGADAPAAAPRRSAGPACNGAPSQRRAFLGKTADTEYLRRLDDFLYDYYVGDAAGETDLRIEVEGQFRWRTPRPLRPGQFAVAVLPVRLPEDGVLAISLAGEKGQPWKLNTLLINKIP